MPMVGYFNHTNAFPKKKRVEKHLLPNSTLVLHTDSPACF